MGEEVMKRSKTGNAIWFNQFDFISKFPNAASNALTSVKFDDLELDFFVISDIFCKAHDASFWASFLFAIWAFDNAMWLQH